MRHVLDHPIWAALTGPHAHLGQVHGGAARYHPDVAPFATLCLYTALGFTVRRATVFRLVRTPA